MNPIRHRLISDLSAEYADSLSKNNPDATFTRGDIAVAYIIGAEEVMSRILRLIKASTNIENGLSEIQSKKLLGLIRTTEGMHKTQS